MGTFARQSFPFMGTGLTQPQARSEAPTWVTRVGGLEKYHELVERALLDGRLRASLSSIITEPS